MHSHSRVRYSAAAALAVAALFLSACSASSLFGGEPDEPAVPVQPKVTGLPATVPDYVLGSDASVVKRDESDTKLTVEMETINGITSPIAYYKKTLPDQGWTIESDNTSDKGGSIVTTKDGKEMRVTFKMVKGTTRIVIELEK